MAHVGPGDRGTIRCDKRPVAGRRLGADGDLAQDVEQLRRMGGVRVEGEEVPMLWTVLALLCIILGFVSAIVEQILIPTLAWFVAAIAFNTLGGISAFTFTKRSE
jgi:hypothetical protein